VTTVQSTILAINPSRFEMRPLFLDQSPFFMLKESLFPVEYPMEYPNHCFKTSIFLMTSQFSLGNPNFILMTSSFHDFLTPIYVIGEKLVKNPLGESGESEAQSDVAFALPNAGAGTSDIKTQAD
jgi:hypothetical protein